MSRDPAPDGGVDVSYTSEWDGGDDVVTEARLDTVTGAVTGIVAVEVGDLGTSTREYVTLPGGQDLDVHLVDGDYVVVDMDALAAAVAPGPSP